MTLTISCPNCSSRYLLPEHLLGPAGARVCCPGCWHRFTVDAAGALVSPEVEPLYHPAAPAGGPALAGSAPAAVPGVGAADGGAPVARDAVLALAHGELAELDPVAPDVTRAASHGRLFAEFGARVLDAFDRYRRSAGRAAGAEPFRRAMRERWEVDLPGADGLGPGSDLG